MRREHARVTNLVRAIFGLEKLVVIHLDDEKLISLTCRSPAKQPVDSACHVPESLTVTRHPMLLAANCWTASKTMASSLILNSILLYPLSLTASAAVVTLAKALTEVGAAKERAAVVRATIGAILDNIVAIDTNVSIDSEVRFCWEIKLCGKRSD